MSYINQHFPLPPIDTVLWFFITFSLFFLSTPCYFYRLCYFFIDSVTFLLTLCYFFIHFHCVCDWGPQLLEVHRAHSLRKLPVRYPDLAYGGRPAVNVLLGSLISVHVTNQILSCDTTDCTIGMLNSQSFHGFSIFLDVEFPIWNKLLCNQS